MAVTETASRAACFFTLFDGTRLIAPNLARKAATYSNAELDRVIRHGVRPDGTGVVGMPSDMFQHLNDADLATIITFLRAQPEGRNELPATRFGPVGRLVLLQLKRRYGPLLAPDRIDHDVKRVQPSTNPLAVGRYLAMSVCTECRGQDLRGIAVDGTPDLATVAAYSVEDFRKLMRTGEPLGGRQLDLMRRVARSRFAYFTDHEVEAVYAYLRTLAATPANQ